MRTDGELLIAYANDRHEPAFAELVARHVDWIYSAAIRMVRGDAHLAEDVTQTVFVLLARKARTFSSDAAIGAWLFRALRFVVNDAVRSERRRIHHETKAGAAMAQQRMRREKTDTTETSALWDELAPELEAAVASLGSADRRAVLLRFYERKPYAQIAAALGTSETAAQMRVSRALDKLRALLGRRGVTASIAAISAAMTAHTVQAAPAAVVTASVNGTAAALSAPTTSLVKGALIAMAWSKTKVVAGIALTALLATVTTVVVYRQSDAPRAMPTAGADSAPVFSIAEDHSEWRAKFDRMYTLAPDQTVRFIKPPFIDERMQFFLSVVGGGPNRTHTDMKTGPKSLYLECDPASRTVPRDGIGMWNNDYSPLSSVFKAMLGVEEYELEAPANLLKTQMHGDWVARAGSTREQRLPDLERVLRDDCGLPVKIVKRRAQQDVVVVSGTITSPDVIVQVYSDRMHNDKPQEGIHTQLDDFLRQLAMFTHHRVLNETAVPADQKIGWAAHNSARVHNMPPKRAAAKLDLILANVSRQSGLQLRREMRAVDVWEVTADEAPNAPQ